MDNYEENDAIKSLFNEMAGDNLKKISLMIRGIPQKDRLNWLRKSNPPNPLLINVYKTAKLAEDYETCEVAKALLLERGISESQIPT